MKLSLLHGAAGALAAIALLSATPAFSAGFDLKDVSVNADAAALVPKDVKAAGSFSVASDASYPPFEYFAEDNTTMIGYDIDVSDAIAATLGLKATHVNATFGSILPGLASGKYDMALSAFGITEDRKKVVDFVGPYFDGGTGLAVAAGNPLKLTMDPMALCGHRISGQAGSFQVDKFLPKMSKDCVAAGKDAIDIKVYRSQNEANLALISGRVDGVLADSAPLAYQGKLAKDRFELAPGPDFDPTPFGIAIPKDSALEPAVQAGLKVIIADGTLDKILKKWGLSDSWMTAAGE
jgi:polar amino acid transport system substrate-binding protein